MPKIFLAFESIRPGNGGICRVARLILRVIVEGVNAGRVDANLMIFNGDPVREFNGIHVFSGHGSRLRFLVRSHRASLTHSHFVYDFLGMARAHCRLPLLKKPYLAWIHGIEVWEQTRADRLACAQRAAVLVANSNYTRSRADRLHGDFARAEVCWLATDTDDLPKSNPPRSGPPTVLILGRMDEGGGYKGHRELIACWPSVVAAIPDARLLLVGDGPGRPWLQRLVEQSFVRSRIEMRGFVAESDLDALWCEVSVLAMPSRGEGFGLVYIEAMRQGVPIIASTHDAASEINVDGVTGFNVNLEKPDELPERLIFLLKDLDRAKALGQNGKARWLEHFRYSCFRERFLPILDEFLKH